MNCCICTAPWHPATGSLVGHPIQFAMCGRCVRESYRCMAWAVSRKPKKGQPDFYVAAGSSAPVQDELPPTPPLTA